MKSLLLDIGNTRLKWGIANGTNIGRTGHVTQQHIAEKGLSVLTTRLPTHVDRAIASNVAGHTIATRVAGLVGAHCHCDLHFAKTVRSGFGVTNAYKQPRRMGTDRWVAMVGAWAEVGGSCLVVDAGTAVTLDAIDDDGRHLGGMILPGLMLMGNALADGTSDILASRSRKSASADMDLFGKNTRTAVEGGAHAAVAGAVEHAITVLRSNAYDPAVVLTGGDASRILSALGEPALHRPHLVLQGLLHMLEDDS